MERQKGEHKLRASARGAHRGVWGPCRIIAEYKNQRQTSTLALWKARYTSSTGVDIGPRPKNSMTACASWDRISNLNHLIVVRQVNRAICLGTPLDSDGGYPNDHRNFPIGHLELKPGTEHCVSIAGNLSVDSRAVSQSTI